MEADQIKKDPKLWALLFYNEITSSYLGATISK